MKRMVMKNVYILLYGGLLFACAFPSMTLFYDQCNTPKWLCTLFMAGLLAVCTAIYYGIKRKRPTGFCHFEAWSEATAMAITLESLYALVSLFKYPATWQLGIAGTFDNPAGLALFLCSLLPFRLCPCSLCFLFRVTCSCAIFHFFAIFVCRPTTASSSSLFLGPPLPGGVHFLPPLRVPRVCPPPFLCDSLGIVINVFNGFDSLKITLSLVGYKIIFIFVGQEF